MKEVSGPVKVGERERILVLTLHYKPEPNFITTDVAESLARNADVTVVTAHPNYPEGRFYPGTKFWKIEKSIENGVTIWRIPYFTDHSLSSIKRTLSYASFALVAAFVAPFVGKRPTAVWVYHGPFMTGLAGLWFKLVYGSKLIYTCADLWPESFVASELPTPPILLDMLFAYSRWINRAADFLICCTRGTLERYATDGISRERMAYVPVWVDGIPESAIGNSARGENDFRVVYAGNLGPAQPLETLIRAAAILQRAGHAIQVDIYGTGSREAELRALAMEEGTRAVKFHGRVSPERAFEVSSVADAQIVALRASPLFRMTIPSKLSFAMAAGGPLVYGLEGESAKLAKEAGGIPFEPENPESLARALRSLMQMSRAERDQLRHRLTEFYARNFKRSELLRQYSAFFIQKEESIRRDEMANAATAHSQ